MDSCAAAEVDGMALRALLRLLLLPPSVPDVEKIDPDEVGIADASEDPDGDETVAELELGEDFFRADILISGLTRSCCSICGVIMDKAEGICCECWWWCCR